VTVGLREVVSGRSLLVEMLDDVGDEDGAVVGGEVGVGPEIDDVQKRLEKN